MSKAVANKTVVDVSHFCKSTFTLTFAVEIIGTDVWRDCNEGWLDLGPSQQGIKLQYVLYPGQCFDIDILIWPHVAKVWCGNQYGYVRIWQFLERRWLAFSIGHAFPVRVNDFINHVATISCTMGLGSLSTNAKNDKNFKVFLPPLKFGERRYFGPVLEKEETIEQIMQNILWNLIREHIPPSYLDGIFDTPYNTSDIRHQDAILYNVQDFILSKSQESVEELPAEPEEFVKSREKHVNKTAKEKEKKKVVEVQKEKFAIILSGDAILAGCGRIIPFETFGERPPEQSEVRVLISSNNLPAEDDYPIIFINIESLYDAPVEELRKARISHIFTRWKVGEEEHESPKQAIKSMKCVKINDHHTVPLQYSKASEITTSFLENPFEIQLCGVMQPRLACNNPLLFGNDKNDYRFRYSSSLPQDKITNDDVVIAVTKIDASALAKESSGIVRGEFCLYPPKVSVTNLYRNDNCTNDINAIRQPIKPEVVIQPSVILQAQMTLDVSIGLVGCRPHSLTDGYQRFYCYANHLRATNAILQKILEINQNLLAAKNINDLLTGFALDTIDAVIFYVEGQRDGPILKVWELTADYYPNVKPFFSCSDQHICRIYTEMLTSATPFLVLKMFVPINTLLACPQVYVKPALPLPAKSALLKIGRLIANKLMIVPSKSQIPTNEELKSFRLELCIPPRPHSIPQ